MSLSVDIIGSVDYNNKECENSIYQGNRNYRKVVGLTFDPIMIYKVFNGNAHLSIYILNLRVPTWLHIILLILTRGLLSFTMKLEGYQYHFR